MNFNEFSKLSIEEKKKLLTLAASRKKVLATDKEKVEERRKLIQRCREDLVSWTIEAQKAEGFKPAKHHLLLLDYLSRVARGEIKRLMIFMPPGSAKSRYASQLFPVWMFSRKNNYKIIGASHTTDLALDFSGKIQNYIMENEEILGYQLKTENKHRWYTSNGGAYLAAGVRTAIPGFRADLGILDDPVKGRQEADSVTDREHVWNWYLGSFERRLTPGAAVILIMTRWHQDDLAGRLLQVEPERWTVLSLPAEAEQNDALGRQPGEWLWDDDDYGYADSLAEIKAALEKAGATREWAAQYQQHPTASEGSLFKVGMLRKIKTEPPGEAVRAWDFAATTEVGSRDPDWTRGVKLIRTDEGRFVVADVKSVRGTPEDVEKLVLTTAFYDGKGVRIGLGDPGQAGKFQAMYLAKKLAGYIVDVRLERGKKEERAAPIASQVNIGNVDIVEAPWNASFIDELSMFPFGTHDDQVDALSRAFEMLLKSEAPFILSEKLRSHLTIAGPSRFRNRMARTYTLMRN